MTTVRVKPASNRTLTQAPMVGIHLPTPKDKIADHVATQMKTSPKMIWTVRCPTVPMFVAGSKKNWVNTSYAVIVSAPPSQMGLDSQYMTAFIDPMNLPRASFVQT